MGIGWLGTLAFLVLLLAGAWLRSSGPGFLEIPAIALEVLASAGLVLSFIAAIVIPFVGRR